MLSESINDLLLLKDDNSQMELSISFEHRFCNQSRLSNLQLKLQKIVLRIISHTKAITISSQSLNHVVQLYNPSSNLLSRILKET